MIHVHRPFMKSGLPMRITRVVAIGVFAGMAGIQACDGGQEGDATRAVPATTAIVAGLHYESAGHGPAVVLIHGAGLDLRMWDEQFEILSNDFLVIRYDTRGFGRSAPASEPFSHVGDLETVLNEVGVSSVSLVGLSLGGAIALNFALTHPDRIDRLLLVGPAVPGAGAMPEEPDRFQRIVRLAAEGRTSAAVDEWLAGPHMSPAMANPRIAPTIRSLAMDNQRTWIPGGILSTPVAPPTARRLHDVRAPTAVLVGARDDRSVRQQGTLVAERVPAARLTVLPEAGHLPNLEAPESFNQWLLDELRRPTP